MAWVQNGGRGQFLDTAVGEIDQAAGVVREPKVLFVAPITLRRHGVAQEGVERASWEVVAGVIGFLAHLGASICSQPWQDISTE